MALTGELILVLGQAGDAEEAGIPAADIFAPLLMVVGVVMLGVILTMSIRGKIARREAATPTPREQIERIKAGAAGREDVQSAGAEMLQAAQQLAAQLDAKTERLERLLAEAEQRVAELQSAAAPPADEAVKPVAVESIAPPAEPPDPLTAAVYELADAGAQPGADRPGA